MSDKNKPENPFVYPFEYTEKVEGSTIGARRTVYDHGISLRDQVASNIYSEILRVESDNYKMLSDDNLDFYAQMTFQAADAFLKARNQEKE